MVLVYRGTTHARTREIPDDRVFSPAQGVRGETIALAVFALSLSRCLPRWHLPGAYEGWNGYTAADVSALLYVGV